MVELAPTQRKVARDRFIGWSVCARRVHREEVVSNSRFLLLPWVQIRNLASTVLALAVKRLATDWQRAYGYRPLLLEIYVDRERFRGTCYRAANRVPVGRTSGRGRQDRQRSPQRPLKDIYLYPLTADWQRRLCREPLRRGGGWRRAVGRSRSSLACPAMGEYGGAPAAIHQRSPRAPRAWRFASRR